MDYSEAFIPWKTWLIGGGGVLEKEGGQAKCGPRTSACTPLRRYSWGPCWGFLCRTSIFENGNVACLCRLFSNMSHVEFRKNPCLMSLSFHPHVACHLALFRMSILRKAYVVVFNLGVKGHVLNPNSAGSDKKIAH